LIEKKGNDGSLMGTQDYELFDIQKIPEFPCDPAFASAAHCGQSSLSAYLSKNIRYPADAREFGIQGTAIVTFVVEKDGSITQLKVVRGWCESIRQECIRVVGGMPRWKPGTANDKPVKVKFTLPIRFRLE
jgi:TonB family protein